MKKKNDTLKNKFITSKVNLNKHFQDTILSLKIVFLYMRDTLDWMMMKILSLKIKRALKIENLK